MKKYLLAMFGVLFLCGVACAGYTYTETETITTYERFGADVGCGFTPFTITIPLSDISKYLE